MLFAISNCRERNAEKNRPRNFVVGISARNYNGRLFFQKETRQGLNSRFKGAEKYRECERTQRKKCAVITVPITVHTTDDPVGWSYQLFSNGIGGELRGDTDIEVFFLCWFFLYYLP